MVFETLVLTVILTGLLGFGGGRALVHKEIPIRFFTCLLFLVLLPGIAYPVLLEMGIEEGSALCFSLWASALTTALALFISSKPEEFSFQTSSIHWYAVALVMAVFFWFGTELWVYFFEPTEQKILSDMQTTNTAVKMLLLVYAVFWAPLLEELLFRGLLFEWLIKQIPPYSVIAISAVGFGCLHMESAALIIPLSILGVMLGWLRYKSDSIWPSFLLHACNNLIAVLFAILDC